MSVDKFGRHSLYKRNTDSSVIGKTKLGHYDVGGKRLCNVANPVGDLDAVNRTFLMSSVPKRRDEDKEYSFQNYNLKRVAPPKDNGDAVNLAYVKDNCLLVEKNYIDARSKPIINITSSPSDETSAVTFRSMSKQALCKHYEHPYLFDAQYCRIINLTPPYDLGDAATKGYVKDMISDIAYTIYTRLPKSSTRPRSSTMSREDWNKAVKFNTKWEDMFNN